MARHPLKAFDHAVVLLFHEVMKFGTVGVINFFLDVGLFNLLIAPGFGPLDNKPITAKTISTVIAATSSYFMNRHWTWRHRARTGLRREYSLFLLLSAIALGITLGCLAFGEYVLGQDSLLARNFWGNIVGVGLAMVFRFWSFKRWVFLPDDPDRDEETAEAVIRTTV